MGKQVTYNNKYLEIKIYVIEGDLIYYDKDNTSI